MAKKSANLDSLHKVWDTKELSKLSRAVEAKTLLDKIAATVGPVMARRKWKVTILKEFYPDQAGLLGMNVNRGASILIRLRKADNINEFFSWEHLIGTMVHELTHMQIGEHSAEFYRLMDEIHDEVDKDIDSGNVSMGASVSTSSFQGEGHKLGGKVLINSAVAASDRLERSKIMANAALNRLNNQKLTAGSGRKLDEISSRDKPLTKEELRQRAVLAAQRRLRDDQSCRHGSSGDIQTNQKSSSSSSVTSGIFTMSGSATDKSLSSVNGDNDVMNYDWSCTLCDTLNIISTLSCSFCSSPSPSLINLPVPSSSSSSTIHTATIVGNNNDDGTSTILLQPMSSSSMYCGPCTLPPAPPSSVLIRPTKIATTLLKLSSSSSSQQLDSDDIIIIDNEVEEISSPATLPRNARISLSSSSSSSVTVTSATLPSPPIDLTEEDDNDCSMVIDHNENNDGGNAVNGMVFTSQQHSSNTVLDNNTQETWSCLQCTLVNSNTISVCVVCGYCDPNLVNNTRLSSSSSIQQPQQSRYTPTDIVARGITQGTWECRTCTFLNTNFNGNFSCLMCGINNGMITPSQNRSSVKVGGGGGGVAFNPFKSTFN